MKTIIITLCIFIMILGSLSAQVAINSDGSQPYSSAMVDAKSTDKGFYHDHPGCFTGQYCGWGNSFVGTYPL